ncbi:YdcF family protein [Haematomicrobium sanguinis]|uniref:YdcF family protein n=1 Tax=Haematomicrobium sanguinis TaxID=479106 RepID=UPI000A07A49E|nr:YdcF family protein [Haematomicrobium sanguinis]
MSENAEPRAHPSPHLHPRRRRILKRVLATLAALLLLWFAAGLYLFVFLPLPQADRESAADAVVVLGGASRERLPAGLEAIRSGQAKTLVLSNPETAGNRSTNSWCAAGAPIPQDIVCFTPKPNNTSGEAKQIGALAKENGWRSIIIVTSRYHEARASLLISQCTDATLIAKPTEPNFTLADWAGRFIEESAGILAALVTPAC